MVKVLVQPMTYCYNSTKRYDKVNKNSERVVGD